MAIPVKNAADSAAKFAQRAAAAGPQYTAGVANAGTKWASNTVASATNWAAGVQTAITDGRFASGVQGSGPKYQTNASTKGARNYVPGVQAAGPTWQAKVTPFLNVIANLTLPPKAPKGSPANIQRVSMIADALRQAKLSGL
jgi:hypothetical protein